MFTRRKTLVWVVMASILFSNFYFLLSMAAAQEDLGVPSLSDYDKNLNELLSPVTEGAEGIGGTIKGLIRKLLEIDFASLWSEIKEGFNWVSQRFEGITGISLIESLKALGVFALQALELLIRFFKWLLSFVN